MLLRVIRRHDVNVEAPQGSAQECAELERLGAQALHARFLKQLECGDERRAREDRWITHLPARCARRGGELWPHLEPGRRIVAPPACKVRHAAVALVYEASADGPRACIEVLVA